jgi:hypothetical protein
MNSIGAFSGRRQLAIMTIGLPLQENLGFAWINSRLQDWLRPWSAALDRIKIQL